jgi:hypothetical protein
MARKIVTVTDEENKEVEVDAADVLSQMDARDVLRFMDESEFINEIDISDFVKYYGPETIFQEVATTDLVVRELGETELVTYMGADTVLNELDLDSIWSYLEDKYSRVELMKKVIELLGDSYPKK